MLKTIRILTEVMATAALCSCGGDTMTGSVTIRETRSFTTDFERLREVVPRQGDSSFVASVTHLVVGPDGRILITDGVQSRVFIFTENGERVVVLGRPGQGPGEFRSAFRSRFLADGGVAVLDGALRRIQFFGRDGSLLRILTVDRYARVHDFVPLTDGSLLLAVTDPTDARVLVRMSAAGEVEWRDLDIRDEVPDGETAGAVWNGPRLLSLAVARDTAWVTTSLRSTLWNIALNGRAIARTEVAFPGYHPPDLPAPSAGVVTAERWMAEVHLTALLQHGPSEMFWPFIQGQPYQEAPRMLVRRDGLGRWSVYDDVPLIVAAAGDTLVVVRDPGADDMTLEYYRPR